MSADHANDLRRAAAEIREDYSAASMGMPTDDAFMFAVADLLDLEASRLYPCRLCEKYPSDRTKRTLAVARAYLGDAS